MVSRCVITVALMVLVVKCALGMTLSSRLIHRFSDEMGALRVLKGGGGSGSPPARRSLGYYRMLMNNDVQRQKMKLGPKYQYLFPSEGSNTKSLGNDFGWLHYTWIDIGTPKISFLVALDAGSDLLWVPCDCIQCAPLSASYYNSLDRNLNQYSPSGSTTSKHLTCSHQLCELGPNCQSPKQQCPYTVNYYSQDTSTSGFLVEDTFHLAAGSGGSSNLSVQARVVIGCGRKQSGGYLDGVAPDGLLGLGFGDISVPSFLAKAGLVQNSFSLCFNDDGSGRIFFGDQGPADQRSTPFLASDGKYIKYTVAVKTCCVGTSCFDNTNFKALVDSGTSFTFLPKDVYERVVKEFDRQINATRADYEGSPWNYCYKTSSQMMPTTPSVALKFSVNNSFVIHNPFFIVNNDQGMDGFCLAIQPADEDIATIGQNFMTGYRMVFDRENLKLGWSRSNCEDHSDGKGMPLTPSNNSSPKPLPTTEQQRAPSGHAVAPAVAGRTPAKPSAAPTQLVPSHLRLAVFVLLSLLVLHPLPALCI